MSHHADRSEVKTTLCVGTVQCGGKLMPAYTVLSFGLKFCWEPQWQ